MEQIVTELAKQSPYVALLIFAIVWLVRRDDRMDRAAKAESTAREAISRAECLEREHALAARLGKVEDRQNQQMSDLLSRSVDALETHGRVMEKLLDDDTGLHRALTKVRGDT